MDFQLSDHQLELQDAVRGFCEREHPLAGITSLDLTTVHPQAWAQLADLGVFRLAAPAAAGGLGLGIVETAAVFEVLGSYLVPGPLVWTALAAIHLPELAARAPLVGGLDATREPSEPALVDHGPHLDAVVVLRGDGVHVIGRGELEQAGFEEVEPTDPLTPVARLGVVPQGTKLAGCEVGEEMARTGRVLASALLVGLAQRSLDQAVTHAGQRVQFDRPIGSFQAIKHLLADMYVRTFLARSSTYAAAAITDGLGPGDAGAAASAAKLVSADAALGNAKACIQVHGGMGFTWEMIPHYLLKRSWVLEHAFGARADHAEAIALDLASEVAR